MNDISIRRGETLQLPIESDDDSAVSVRFLATKENVVYIDETENFVDGEATIRTEDTDFAVGEYEFSLTVTYSDGVIDILPDPDDCGDDCDLPKLLICASNTSGVVS